MASKAVAVRRVYMKPRRRIHRGGFTIPLLVVAGFAPAAIDAWNTGYQRKDQPGGRLGGMFHALSLDFAAYNTDTHSLDTNHLGTGWGALTLGIIAHKILGQTLGVNRMLARHKIPFIRL